MYIALVAIPFSAQTIDFLVLLINFLDHLTLKQDDSSTYDVDLEFEGKDLDFEVKKVADNKFEGEGAVVEFLNNNEVRITIDGKVIEFFMLDGHEGHGHGHEHHHNH